MGKEFNKAKNKIKKLEIQKEIDFLVMNNAKVVYEKTVSELRRLQRKWYGAADGDIATISSFENMIKAAKRWIK